MRKRLHFDGEPDRFSRMHALFAEANFCPGWRVKWSAAIDRKFRLSRLQTLADRILKRAS